MLCVHWHKSFLIALQILRDVPGSAGGAAQTTSSPHNSFGRETACLFRVTDRPLVRCGGALAGYQRLRWVVIE